MSGKKHHINPMIKKMLSTTFGKVAFITVLFVIFTTSAFAFYIIPRINQSLMSEKQYMLHEISSLLIATLNNLNDRVISGELDEAEAKKIATEIISNYRYGKNGDDYFWVNNVSDGIILIHPNDTIRGANLENLSDETGYNFGAVMLAMARNDEEGYVKYMWMPKHGDTTIAVPKLSHVTVFKPWGWMIGTGMYIDDVQKEIVTIMWRIIGIILLILFLLIGLLAFILRVGAKIEEQKNLLKSEFVSLIQHLPIGMFRIRMDKPAPPLLWNNALLELLEIPDKKHLQKPDFDFVNFFKNKDEKEKFKNLLLKKHEVMGEELEIMTFKNNTLWVKIYGKIIPGKDALYFDASVENITEKRRLRENMQKSYVELKKVDKMKNEIISITSHELRTPLTIIKGFASMLLNGMFGEVNETQKNYTEKIINNTDKLLEMVTNMLDLEKLESGKMQFDIEDVDLNNLIEKTYNDFRMRCSTENKNLIFHAADPHMLIATDPTQLRRIIINLIDNAIKFTQPDIGRIEIFTKKLDSDRIEIHVKDNGIGIASADLHDIFKKFKQVGGHMKRVSGGSGLGLPIAKKLITQLGGDIYVESALGEGSDFYVILNIKK
jgi:signal transduction histidine kinase